MGRSLLRLRGSPPAAHVVRTADSAHAGGSARLTRGRGNRSDSRPAHNGDVVACCSGSRPPHRLAEDHENARVLAKGIADLPGVHIDLDLVTTNIVIFDVDGSASAWLDRIASEGVHGVAFGPQTVRLTTHYGITGADIDAAIAGIRRAFAPVATA